MSMLVERISGFWDGVQSCLFPALEEAGLELSAKLYQLVALLEVIQIERFVPARSPYRCGVKPKDRRCLARAFLAMAFYGGTDRGAFRERLLHDAALRKVCGWASRWAVPSESTFCRAFALFAEIGLADTVHAALVQEWRGEEVVWHAATDATAIPARERPVTRAKPVIDADPPKKKRKIGRPKKGEAPPPKEPTRLERQVEQEPEIALLELATACDVGGKRDSKGNTTYWVGYKFHVSVDEWGLPLAAVTTAASVHDSQVAIPLFKLARRRVTVLYDLLDKAYDAAPIWALSEKLGHRPIIDRMKRRGQDPPPPMEPDRAERFKGRTVAERFNARLKDEFGGLVARVRGHRKMHAYLMFGTLVIFADQLLRIGQ
jgi:IS5 family transposase